MAKQKRFDGYTKVGVLKRHLQKKEPISSLCEELGVTPGAVYQWQETLFARGHICFDSKMGRPVDAKKQERLLNDLENKLKVKNQIISELMEELLLEKKQLGAP